LYGLTPSTLVILYPGFSFKTKYGCLVGEILSFISTPASIIIHISPSSQLLSPHVLFYPLPPHLSVSLSLSRSLSSLALLPLSLALLRLPPLAHCFSLLLNAPPSGPLHPFPLLPTSLRRQNQVVPAPDLPPPRLPLGAPCHDDDGDSAARAHHRKE
jgi:hypothetical protein